MEIQVPLDDDENLVIPVERGVGDSEFPVRWCGEQRS